MKEEDLSRIKRYPIVEYLERKGIKPVRKTPTYAMYRSPLRAETYPSFKVDTEKNLWIDYGEGRGGSIIDLCMRMEGYTLSEAIRRLGQNAPDDGTYSSLNDFVPNNPQPVMVANGARRLIEISDTLPPHFQEYLTKVRCINLEKAMPFLKCISYEVRSRLYQAIGFANLSGGYELRDNGSFKGTIAPKDITPIFTDKQTDRLRSIREYRSNVLRSYRSLERLVVPKLIAAREIGKADGLIAPAPYLIADTFEERRSLFQVDTAFLRKIIL